ncbi:MAG: hypothetical protein ACYSR4_10715 [Planctomycetota bacterium]|jgi:hypothetical protein
MKFVDFVCFEAVILGLNAADRDGVIAELPVRSRAESVERLYRP